MRYSKEEATRRKLLMLKYRRALTNTQLGALIGRPSGKHYSFYTVGCFLRDDRPGTDWSAFVEASQRLVDGPRARSLALLLALEREKDNDT